MSGPLSCDTCRWYDNPPAGHYGHCWWGKHHLRPKWDEPYSRTAVLVNPADGRPCDTWESPDAY